MRNLILSILVLSSIIDFVLYRYDAVGLATVNVKSFDLHVELEKLGTINEYPTIP